MSDLRVVSVGTVVRSLRQRLRGGKRDPVEVVREVLESQPSKPDLVGAKVAAEMVGMQPAHVSRAIGAERFPEPIEVEGSSRAFYRSDVEEFARQREAERHEREQRKAAEK